MSARRYEVRCASDGCQELAQYKIAAAWCDGTTSELKTYELACEHHLEALYRRAQQKRVNCRVAEDETLSPPQIFQLEIGKRDRQLHRLLELEAKLDESGRF